MAHCDHTSVGILIFKDGKLLLIDRKTPPYGMAPPAGHVDEHGKAGDTEEQRYEAAAHAETEEEVGLKVADLQLIVEGRKENACKRPGGSWHYWRIYRANVTGELAPSREETLGAYWCTKEQVASLMRGEPMRLDRGEVTLEPVWQEWFPEIDILEQFLNTTS